MSPKDPRERPWNHGKSGIRRMGRSASRPLGRITRWVDPIRMLRARMRRGTGHELGHRLEEAEPTDEPTFDAGRRTNGPDRGFEALQNNAYNHAARMRGSGGCYVRSPTDSVPPAGHHPNLGGSSTPDSANNPAKWNDCSDLPTLSPARFVGRATELETLRGALGRLRLGSGGVILIQGEAGIGKSRLLREVLDQAELEGFRTVVGAARELETERPFGAVSEALGVARAADEGVRPIRDLLEAPEHDVRFQVSDLVADLLEAWAAGGGVVLALEDIHWADASTLLVLDRVGRLAPTIRLLVLATARPIPRSRELIVTLDAVEPEVLALGPLDENETRTLAAQTLAATPSEGLMKKLRTAAGNPLFETEMAAALQEEGSIVVEGGVAEATNPGLPPALHLTILRRVGFLPEATLDVLRLAAILGSSFSVEPLSAVSGRSAVDLLGALKPALDAGVVLDQGATFGFRHDLVRDAIYEDVPEALRRTLHHAAGRALLRMGAPAIEAARQVRLGAMPGDEEAVDVLVEAARDAGWKAPVSQVEFLREALELLPPSSPRRPPLLADLSVALFLVGDGEEGEAAATEALSSPGLDSETEIKAGWGLMYGYAGQSRHRDAIAHMERFLSERKLPTREHVRMRLNLAQARVEVQDLSGAGNDLEETLPLLAEVGDASTRALEMIVRALILGSKGQLSEALGAADRGVVEALDSKEWDEIGAAFRARASILQDLDRFHDALTTWRELGRLMDRITGLTPRLHSHMAGVKFAAGAWDEMEVELLTAESSARELPRFAIDDMTSWLRALTALHRNDTQAAKAHIEDGPHTEGYPFWPWVEALLDEAEGRTDAALARFVEARRGRECALVDTAQWAPDAVRIALAAGERAAAAAFADDAEMIARRMRTASARSAALRCRGLVERDAALLKEAVEAGRTSPRALDQALTMEDAARLTRGDEAVPLLEDALETLEGLGADRHARRVHALLRKHGVQRAASRRARASFGWESLTESELRVADLVAEGLRNRQIAERLYLSVRTVESHVSRALTKLGITSRVELAALVLDRARRRHAGLARGAPK